MESQLKLNQEVLITIKSIGIDGEGVGFYKRQAVFVKGAVPPEEVVIKITKLNKGHAIGEIVRIKKKSYYRRPPLSKKLENTSGFELQHVLYEEQQRLKEGLLKQSFERFTDIDLTSIKIHHFNPIVKPLYYQKQTNQYVLNTKKDGLMSALLSIDGKSLNEVSDNPLYDKDLNALNKEILSICDDHEIYAFDDKTKRGLLRRLVSRKSHFNGEIQVTLVVTIFNKVLKDAAKAMLDLPGVSSVAISKNHDAKNKNTFGDTYEILEGKGLITEKLGDITYQLTPVDRFPVNPSEAENMYEYISTLLKDRPNESMVNFYAKSGTLGLYQANTFKQVTLVESDKTLLNSAEYSSKENNFNHLKFINDLSPKALQSFNAKNIRFDVGILSPSKQGLNQAMIKHLKQSQIKMLIYVSKNPSTLAKDINHLTAKYDLKSVMPFDMYPQSSRIDAVSVLKIKR